MITRQDLVFGREMGPSLVAEHDLAQAGAQAAQRAAAEMTGVEAPKQTGLATFDPSLLKSGLGFKQAKQTVVDAFEIAYLQLLMQRNEGNITRSAQEAGSRAITCASCSSVTASRAATRSSATQARVAASGSS